MSSACVEEGQLKLVSLLMVIASVMTSFKFTFCKRSLHSTFRILTPLSSYIARGHVQKLRVFC